jgi:hypothetical protein
MLGCCGRRIDSQIQRSHNPPTGIEEPSYNETSCKKSLTNLARNAPLVNIKTQEKQRPYMVEQ